MTPSIRTALAASLLLGLAGAAHAQNSGAGSGLSPFATESGNDRSAGVNNGNYRPPRYNPYNQGFGRPVQDRYRRPAPAPYYGYPY